MLDLYFISFLNYLQIIMHYKINQIRLKIKRIQKMKGEENEIEDSIDTSAFQDEQIYKKKYSIIPDLATGWRPKNLKIPVPIIITYKSLLTNQLLEYYQNQQQKIVYLGPRYFNSFSYHQKIQHKYSLKYAVTCEEIPSLFKKQLEIKQEEALLRKFQGMNPILKSEIIFQSNFEGGNLDMVIKVSKNEYNLFLRPDTNTRGHMQWFDFKLSNKMVSKDIKTIKLNICNNKKQKTLYQRGMKPFILSRWQKNNKNILWHQAGANVSYSKLQLKEQEEERQIKGVQKRVQKFMNYYCLSFQYTFQQENDEVEFAYCPPYTFSDLKCYLQNIKRTPSNLAQNCIVEEKFCSSLSGIEIPILSITNSMEQNVNKSCVVVTGRIHPGESNSSFVMEGFINYLLSDAAKDLRKQVIFKIIPMINPDGVIFGNYRTGLAGKDLNRQFKTKKYQLFPEVCELKAFVKKIKLQDKWKMLYYLDFHGHSLKKNVFVYGPEYDIWSAKYEKAKILPKLISNKTQAFRYKSCFFKVATFKKTTARAFMLSYIPYCYTVESSVGIYQNKKYENIYFTIEKWKDIGAKIAQSLAEIMSKLNQEIKREEKEKRKKMQKKQIQVNQTEKENVIDLTIKSTQKSIRIASSKKYLDPIRNLKKKSIDLIQEYPVIEQAECQSDGFSEGNSDCQSEQNDLEKVQYEILKDKILKIMENFENLIIGKKKNFIITDKKEGKSKKQKKQKEERKKSIEQMRLVPSLKYRMGKINSSEKKIGIENVLSITGKHQQLK